MSKIIVITRKHLVLAALALLLILTGLLYMNRGSLVPALAEPAATERSIHMVTGEFKSTTSDGKTIEAYRWDPGTIVVHKGEKVKLSIYGVNGESHPFFIEGMGISGEVKKGKETVITFTPKEEGTFRLICMTHADIAHHGPMIGYIVVD